MMVGFAARPALLGFRRGFIVGVLAFAGFGVGAFLGTRLGPLLLPRGSSSPYAPAFGLFGALLAGAILASGLEGVGLRPRRGPRPPPARARRRVPRGGPGGGPCPRGRGGPRPASA